MSLLEVELSNYEKYLKYRRPENFQFTSTDKCVWYSEQQDNYEIGIILAEEGDKVKVQTQDQREIYIMKDEAEDLKTNPNKFDGVEDCSTLPYLSDASVLHNLRLRYDVDNIYTYSGLFLVALNPYKDIPIYTSEILQIYQGKRREEVAPHVFSSADVAYRSMLEQKCNQSMLITGESGAGKTESTKKVIQYLASIAGRSDHRDLEKQLLVCNPLLEALGNAKTLKNNNSSRFGKFIKITFDPSGHISGASINSYLLERSRIVHQGPQERSFHIFYQLTHSTEYRSKYSLGSPENYKYLAVSGCTTVKGIDDQKEFKNTIDAMHTLGFNNEEVDTLFSIVAAVLHLGNVIFKPGNNETCSIVDKTSLTLAAKFLKVNPQNLEDSIIRPRIKAGRDLVRTSLNAEKSANSLDALCKALYGRMFLWAVEKINETLKVKPSHLSIGILDIAGFEIFKKNSFEQLCINYTNEKLQQFFNNYMFNLEQQEYKREQLDWKMINFGIDSQVTIDLIEKKPRGIMIILDEESVFPSATDTSFVSKLVAANEGKQPKFRKAKVGASDLTFTVVHYAGDVEYDATQWLEKNKDPLAQDLEATLKESGNPIVSKFMTRYSLNSPVSDSDSQPRGGSRNKGAAFNTIANNYKDQLQELMDTLEATTPHFIRCILPNRHQLPGKIQSSIILDQLRCNGVLEGIRIARKGFPNRQIYADFLKRYYLLGVGIPRKTADSKAAVTDLMKQLVSSKILTEEGFRFGSTKIFFRTGVLGYVEEFRERKISEFIPVIQAASRGYVSRKAFRQLHEKKNAIAVIQHNVRAWLEFKNWNWFKLLQKSRPLLKRRNIDKEFAEKDNEIETLKKRLNEEDNRYVMLDKNLKELQAVNAETKKRLQQLENEKTDMEINNEDLANTKNSLDKKLQELRKEIEDSEITLEESASNKQQLKAKLDAALLELEEEVAMNDKLKNSNTSKNKELIDIKQIAASLENEYQALEKQRKQLEQDLEDTFHDKEDEENAKSQILRLRNQLQEDLERSTEELGILKAQKQELEKKLTKEDSDGKDLRRNLENERNMRNNAESNAKKLQGELERLNASLQKEAKNRIALEKTKKQLEAELERYQDDLGSGEKLLSESENKNKKLYEELDDLQITYDQSISDYQSETNRLQSDIAELERQLADCKAIIAKLEREKKNLESELDEAIALYEEEQRKSSQLSKEKKSLEAELNELEDELGQVEKRCEVIEKARSKLEYDTKNLARDLEEERFKGSTLEGNMKNLQAEYASLRNELESGEKAKSNMERSNKDIESKLFQLEDELGELKDNKVASERKLRDLEAEYNEMKDALEETQDEYNEAMQHREKLEADLDDIRKSLETESEIKNQLDAQSNHIHSELEDIKSSVEAEEARYSSLSKNYKKIQFDSGDLDSRLASLEQELNNVEKTRRKLENELKDNRREIADLKANFANSDSNVRRLNEQIEDYNKKVDALEAKLSLLDKTQRQLQQQLIEAETNAEDKSEKKMKLEKIVRELEGELQAVHEAAEDSESLRDAQDDLNRLKVELDDIKRQQDRAISASKRSEDEKIALVSKLLEAQGQCEEVLRVKSKLEKDRKRVQQELETLSQSLRAAGKQRETLESKLKKAESAYKAAQDSAAQAVDRISEAEFLQLQKQVIAAYNELQNQKSQNGQKDRRIKELNAQVAELQDVIDEMSSLSNGAQKTTDLLAEQINDLSSQLEEEEHLVADLSASKAKRDQECTELRRLLETESEARDKSESFKRDLEGKLMDLRRALENQSKLRSQTEKALHKAEADLLELKNRSENTYRDSDSVEKTKKRLAKELRALEERIEQISSEKSEQEELAWKYQEEVDWLSNKIDQEHALRINEEKMHKSLDNQVNDAEMANDDISRRNVRSAQLFRELESEVKGIRDNNSILRDRLDCLHSQQSQSLANALDAKKALEHEILNREAVEEMKRNIERQFGDMGDQLEQERIARNNAEYAKRKALSDVSEHSNNNVLLKGKISKVETEKFRLEGELHEALHKLSECEKNSLNYTESNSNLENEIYKIRSRIEEEQDRCATAESSQRRHEVEVSKIKDVLKSKTLEFERISEEIERVKKERMELEEKAKAISSFFS